MRSHRRSASRRRHRGSAARPSPPPAPPAPLPRGSPVQLPPGPDDAQDELCQVRADLHDLFQRVPWSAEPLDVWETHENAWRQASRPVSPGWDPQDAAEIARLRKRELELELELAQSIVTHAYWSEFTAADILAARTALKHHHKPEMADASS
ncbi:hypothetical protein [Streptomyces sp. AK08-02]|uniref:hypothetical protein n=1 Tax=Streptomyces sp. AK08-02 TaxID=3028654 RepID=UPI0029BFFB2F|nr:hypothetical protein [Streptomyces sp. AK08-02]